MEGEILLGRAGTTCLAHLDIRALSEVASGFKGKMMLEGDRPCMKSQEAPGTKKCERRLELVDQEMIDWFKTRQPAPPVLPRIRCRPNLKQVDLDAIQAVQDLRDFEWDVLTQYSAYGCAYAWICDCGDDDEEEDEEEEGWGL